MKCIRDARPMGTVIVYVICHRVIINIVIFNPSKWDNQFNRCHCETAEKTEEIFKYERDSNPYSFFCSFVFWLWRVQTNTFFFLFKCHRNTMTKNKKGHFTSVIIIQPSMSHYSSSRWCIISIIFRWQ